MFQKLVMPLVLTGVAALAPSLASADSVGAVHAMCDNAACNSRALDPAGSAIRSGSDEADLQVDQSQASAVQTLLGEHDMPSDHFSAADMNPNGPHAVHTPTPDPAPSDPHAPVPAPEPSTLALLALGLGAVLTGIGQRKRLIQS